MVRCIGLHPFIAVHYLSLFALFLASADSSYLTGQVLFPNGGMFVG